MRDQKQDWMEALLRPQSIALIGVSNNPAKVSGRALAYLLKHGYSGKIYPVNHGREIVQGVPAYRTAAEIPEGVALAVISVAAAEAAEAVRACGDRGIPLAIVYASGFSEVGHEGQLRQQQLSAVAREAGVRLLGPNSLGAISFSEGVTTSFTSALDEGELTQGPVALLTQSGAFASFVFSAGRAAGVGFRFLANTGNEADLGLGEMLGRLVELPDVEIVLSHIEGIRDMAHFERAAARAQELAKPIVVVKVGRSPQGGEAAFAHTGADVGDDREYERVFRRWGIHRVDSIEALLDAANVFSGRKVPTGNGTCIVSISGGIGVLMADACADAGLQVSPFSGDLHDDLRRMLPSFGSARNPVDLTGGVLDDLTMFTSVLHRCAEDPDNDLLLVATGNITTGEDELTEGLIEVVRAYEKPLIVTWVGGSGRPASRLAQAGIPVFTDPTRAVKAAAMLVRHHGAAGKARASRQAEAPPTIGGLA